MSIRISVITPTYNRAETLKRVYDSLCYQSCKDFEWIVIDDGSTDNTALVIREYQNRNNEFPIRYYYQENNGKHIAVNKGVELAVGEFVAIADSDDTFVAEAFDIMLNYWDLIDKEHKKEFRGVTCRCYDPITKSGIGDGILDGGYKDINGLDATYKYGFNYEMWGINRREVMLEYPFPDIRGGKKNGLVFFPESVIWDNMGRKYKVRYITDCLRAYYRDQENATTNRATRRSKENVYLWEHLINDIFDYFRYNPMRFIKAFVGITMDGLLSGETCEQIIKKGKNISRRGLIVVFFPIGFVLFLLKRE